MAYLLLVPVYNNGIFCVQKCKKLRFMVSVKMSRVRARVSCCYWPQWPIGNYQPTHKYSLMH